MTDERTIVGAFILFVVPGIYVTCRLLVCLPVAMTEKRGPRVSVRRSFDLTRGFAGRSFLIVLLVGILNYAVTLPVTVPIQLLVSNGSESDVQLWTFISLLWTAGVSVLLSPILLIAASVFYYDLLVRKESFDLRSMANAEPLPTAATGDPPVPPSEPR